MLLLAGPARGDLVNSQDRANTPISVQLLEVRDGGSQTPRASVPGRVPADRAQLPKLGCRYHRPNEAENWTAARPKASVPSQQPRLKPRRRPNRSHCPDRKFWPLITAPKSVNAKETSPDSLVRLPTKESPTNLPAQRAADLEANQRSLAALKGAGDGPGIKALEGRARKFPARSRAVARAPDPYGVPGGSRSGTGIAGGGTGAGTGGGSTTGLKGILER